MNIPIMHLVRSGPGLMLRIKSLSTSNGTRRRFEYDSFDRLQTVVDSIDNNNKFTASYSYDNQSGDLDNILMNNSVSVDYGYNAYGYMNQVSANNNTVWTANSMNKHGIVDNFTPGNGATTTISMNGRVYDPLMAMFLSPDNFMQSPGSIQGFNRYSYCLNNPLSYADPSGNYRLPVPYENDSNWGGLGAIASGRAFLGGYSAAREQLGLHTAGPSYFSYTYDPSSSSLYRDQNGNEAPFSLVSSSLYNSGSLIGVDDSNRFLDYLSSGFSIYNYNLYGRDNLIASIGDPGLLSIAGGGYGATNNTASVFPIVVSGESASGQGGNSLYAIGVGINAAGFVSSAGEYSNVINSSWRGVNGKWNSLEWGGNKWTGARANALSKAGYFKLASRGLFVVGTGISLYQGGDALLKGDYTGAAKFGLDIGMGAFATFGGPPGWIIGGGYFALDALGVFDRPMITTPYSPPMYAVPDNTYVAPPVIFPLR